jgi:hypothetical protein
MDAIVEAALRRWPNVPHCYGWLALDARGRWFMRDERVQAAGPFPQVKGSEVRHDKLLGFIHRNYGRDADGAAFFQNGPQRVYVELEAAPWVWRVQAAAGCWEVTAHTGQAAGAVRGGWLDELGRLFLECEAGYGIVHPQDMVLVAQPVESGAWPLAELAFGAMPARFGYVLKPQPPDPTA